MSQIKRLDSLTSEQAAMLPRYAEEWTRIGLCTDPADRPMAEAAIREMYRQGGLQPPAKIVWCGSPFSQGWTRAIILDKHLWDSVWDSVGASVRALVSASVGASVRALVSASVRDSVWDSVWDSVGGSVGDSVRASVRDSVWDSVSASVSASVWDSVRDSVWDSVYGQHDANWLAFYRTFSEFGLISQTERLSGLWLLAKSAGWALPHKNICWVSERHHILERDPQGRLHNILGPAVAYPDGWSIYAVHGVRCPADIIERRESLTVERIHGENNAEIRHVMTELYGFDRYVRDASVEPRHKDSLGILYRIENKTLPIQFVRVKNSTPEPDGNFNYYNLRVPLEIETASAAVAYTFGMRGHDYQPRIET